jgi:acyl transferase domain-containing protein
MLVAACVNSPKNLTLSGDAAHLDHLADLLEKDKIFARRLNVTVAYHSFQMRRIADQYRSLIGNLTDQGPRNSLPVMLSSVTGTWVSRDVVSKPDYWVRNMVQPVLFSDALAALCSQASVKVVKKLDGSHRHLISVNQLIEIGPHAALQGPSREILCSIGHENDIAYMSILKRKVSAVSSILEAAGKLHCIGYPIDLASVNREPSNKSSSVSPKTLTNLPEYSFNHNMTYWRESRLSKDSRFRRFGRMDLLGTPSQDWNPLEAKWRNVIRVSEVPWVEDHKVSRKCNFCHPRQELYGNKHKR